MCCSMLVKQGTTLAVAVKDSVVIAYIVHLSYMCNICKCLYANINVFIVYSYS